MTKLAQFKSAKALELAATNLVGTAGAGMGFVLAQQNGSLNAPTPQVSFLKGNHNPCSMLRPRLFRFRLVVFMP
ncbi:hypothetical protein [Maribacter antarcticus]|uniref:hypothetical protein n=1 Tax=Maribacter antarcticus TaxID=505250 RepID=UPI000B097848|nr:hypothetical protein [Maribacter antarcticus]